jgi:hypothetical protein
MSSAESLREFVDASRMMLNVIRHLNAANGFPIMRRFLDVAEQMGRDNRPCYVAPYVKDMLDEFEANCPGVMNIVLHLGTVSDCGVRGDSHGVAGAVGPDADRPAGPS